MNREINAGQIFQYLKARVEQIPIPAGPVYRLLASRLGVAEFEPALQMLSLLATPEQARLVAALPDPDRPQS